MELEEKNMLEERFQLAFGRIGEIQRERFEKKEFEEYFTAVAGFILMAEENYHFVQSGGLEKASISKLQERNQTLFGELMEENYENSFANPAYAVKRLGREFGALMAAVYVEIRNMAGFAYEGELEEMVIRAELFCEIYSAFRYEWEEEGRLPSHEGIRQIFYWFVSDYADMAAEKRTKKLVDPADNFAYGIVTGSDLTDARYLYRYGEYISDNELRMAEFMANLDEKTVCTMADTYTEGYRLGFLATNKDLSKKKTVEIRYPIGFERMALKAVYNFGKMGLQPIMRKVGTTVNRQYEFDHKDDVALVMDKNYTNRKLEVQETAFEKYKELALGYAGPAVIETFGEKEFHPVNKPESIRMSEPQNELWVDFRMRNGKLQRNYIIEEERSFTIIAFPVPEIREALPEKTMECYYDFFREVIKINTLDYMLYRKVQQRMIDVLDTADYCEVKGRGENRTDMRVNLYKLKNPDKETIFENCVADVNIPVGEVFTSPVLSGTEGVLNVSRVYLDGLEYRDLAITFQDGKITDYTCGNFKEEKENLEFIRDNILYRHKTLPIGEFAIGTNTVAYVAAKKYGVMGKLPILIAEKTGPHFAVGDTCYSHSEEVRVYNPDGKEIVAKDNEVSILRNKEPEKAYFNCHTDITIPYEELAWIDAVRKDGSRVRIIENGRFVLPGTQILNEAFAMLDDGRSSGIQPAKP